MGLYERCQNTSVKVITLAFIAFVSLGALAVTSYIQYRNRHIQIDISDFEDINLKDLLNMAKKNENDLRVATRALDDLKFRLRSAIESINNELASTISLIREREANTATRNRRIREAQLAAEQKIEILMAEFQVKIAEQESGVEEIRKRIDEYDQRMVEQVKKQEQILNNQQRLHDMEMEKTVTYYEEKLTDLTTEYTKEIDTLNANHNSLTATLRRNNRNRVATLTRNHQNEVATLKHNNELALNAMYKKYNPVFTARSVRDILNAPTDSLVREPPLHEYQTELGRENILSEDGLRNLRRKLRDSDALLTRLKQVPYENSVPQVLERLSLMSRTIVSEYEGLWFDLVNTVRVKNDAIGVRDKMISQFNYSLETFTRQTVTTRIMNETLRKISQDGP